MARILLPIIAILILSLGVLFGVKFLLPNPEEISNNHTEAGTALPDFAIQRFQGESMPLSKVSGKVSLLNFWASWCDACLVEIPSIIRLWKSYEAKGFQVLLVNLDETPDTIVPKLVSALQIPFPVYVDPQGKVAQALEVHAIPFTVIFDRNRKILFTEAGERDWSSEEVRSKIESWLAL